MEKQSFKSNVSGNKSKISSSDDEEGSESEDSDAPPNRW